jgi:hypothetical protein
MNELALSNQVLAGTIPDDVGLLTGFVYFYVYGNQLMGSLPSYIGLWTSLFFFDVGLNQLLGTVPKEVSKWTMGLCPSLATIFAQRMEHLVICLLIATRFSVSAAISASNMYMF